jgi:hypothetical protein
MKTKIYTSLTLLILAASLVCLPLSQVGALAACNGNDTEICKSSPADLIGTNGVLKNVISILLYVAGTIAVIMIIVGALRYITSDGDPGKASTARMTVIYALVGLVIAVMSYGIVNFVIGKL